MGESESSLRSQGHYRVYFGLGDATETEAMVVWPDGSEQQLGALSANQLVELSP